eukprot:2638160-Pyramimonas_sp.AAC.1
MPRAASSFVSIVTNSLRIRTCSLRVQLAPWGSPSSIFVIPSTRSSRADVLISLEGVPPANRLQAQLFSIVSAPW